MIYYILNIVGIAGVSWLLYRLITPKLRWQAFVVGLLLKLLCGCLLGLLYMYHYEGVGDTLTYHEMASILAKTAHSDWVMFIEVFIDNPFPQYQDQPRAWFMVQVVSLFHIFTNSNYWLTACWFSFFSFAGLYFLASSLAKIFPLHKNASFIAFLFFPSVVFWSSGIIKESIALFSIGVVIGSVIRFLYKDRNYYYLLPAVLCLFLLWQVKYYVAAVWVLVLVPFIVTFFIGSRYRKVNPILLSFLIIAVIITFLHPNFYPHRVVEVIFINYMAYQEASSLGDVMVFPYEQPDAWFIILNTPFALFTTLFLPLIPNNMSAPSIFASVENWVLFLLFSGWLAGKIKNHFKMERIEVMLLVYIAVLAVFLGLSAPNYGTLARFRVSFLPFFVWLILVNNYLLLKFNIDFERIELWIKNR